MESNVRYILHSDRTAVLRAVSEAPDGHYVEIKPSTRTSEQNRLYWAELQTLSEKCGHTPELWHEFFLRHFVKPETAEIAGEVIIMRPSTTKLSKQEFSDYIEQVFSWLAENVR
jgi:hypothetical protein